MGSPYRQFCPVAKAVEPLDVRCTLLVDRALVLGSPRVDELRRGAPRMSPRCWEKRTEGTDVQYVLLLDGA
ncbi:hypothetical protein ACFU53_34835 [Streptomyces sp. NPDC057474]|uniref:hypothetical protein n=1 Tax=Streptomyces sp. NPDC057474 TaxID=3346144 RepID=UPI0036B151DB